MQKQKGLIIALSIVATELIGFAGTFFTIPSIQGWYTTINKPSFNPPNWIFGPVWTTLFLLIGISLGLVINLPKEARHKTKALIAFAVQLILNLGWSYVFFYLHRPGLALIEIGLLLLSIMVNIYYAGRDSKAAGWLLVPYLLWVGFASILNLAIWILN